MFTTSRINEETDKKEETNNNNGKEKEEESGEEEDNNAYKYLPGDGLGFSIHPRRGPGEIIDVPPEEELGVSVYVRPGTIAVK